MQIDQATQLRQLVSRVQASDRRPARSPRLIVVASGKGGVGATSIAVNLAVALAAKRRVALVDCDLDNADATALCGIEPKLTLVDVLQATVTASDTLRPGPLNIRVLPGLWGANQIVHCTAAQTHRLVAELHQLELCDDVVLDVGAGSSELAIGLWRAADQVITVLTPDTTALMNTYAAIKRFIGDAPRPILAIVNHAGGPGTAAEIHRRLADSARRFLSFEVELLGWLPFDPGFESAGCHRTVVHAFAPDCAAATAMQAMAGTLVTASSARSTEETAARLMPSPTGHGAAVPCTA